MPKAPCLYEVNGKLVTGKGSLILICSLSNHSLLPSLTVLFLNDFMKNLQTRNALAFLPLYGSVCYEYFLYAHLSTLFFIMIHRQEAKKKLTELKEKFSLEDDFDDLDFGDDDDFEDSDTENSEN